MKIPKHTVTQNKTPAFVKNDTLTLLTNEVDGKIISFTVTFAGQEKVFPVKNFNILEAWKKVEVFTKSIK